MNEEVWWQVDVIKYLYEAPDAGWGYGGRFSVEAFWPQMEQQWADSLGLGINAKEDGNNG